MASTIASTRPPGRARNRTAASCARSTRASTSASLAASDGRRTASSPVFWRHGGWLVCVMAPPRGSGTARPVPSTSASPRWSGQCRWPRGATWRTRTGVPRPTACARGPAPPTGQRAVTCGSPTFVTSSSAPAQSMSSGRSAGLVSPVKLPSTSSSVPSRRRVNADVRVVLEQHREVAVYRRLTVPQVDQPPVVREHGVLVVVLRGGVDLDVVRVHLDPRRAGRSRPGGAVPLHQARALSRPIVRSAVSTCSGSASAAVACP